MASTFRASPWVTYQPPEPQPQGPEVAQQPPDPAGTTMIMDMDVDMDAPQISTLREEESPPPTKKPGPSRKPKAPKLKVAETPRPERKAKVGPEEGLEELGEDEEDQLIDDDDALANPTSSATLPASARSVESTPKKKPGPKKKAKKEKQGTDDTNDLKKLVTENTASQPSGTPESSSQITVEGTSGPPEPIMLKLSTAGKRKQASPRKTTSTPRGRGRGAKSKAALVPHVIEDAAMSEAGYTGTAPSSPGTALMDLPDLNDPDTPEIDNTTVAPSSPPAAPTVPLTEEAAASLEGIPIPQYPLPAKPFPVQPPIKIASGFAPPLPLDRSIKKVRHWRSANREIRGIAGGRWFARTWVGGKESEYASSNANGDDRVILPGGASMAKLTGMSLSAPPGKGRGRGSASKAASAVASAVPSRAGSAGPEGPPIVVRPPTKMRILQLAPSENGDSDMAPPDS